MNEVKLTGNNLTIENILDVAEKEFKVTIAKESREKIEKGRKLLEDQITGEESKIIPIYGTNRLHGDLKNIAVDEELLEKYQVKYINVHNCGTGKPLEIRFVRAIMLIRLNSFCKGLSGMQIETCEMLLEMLNEGVTPEVLEEGSVGASGDLVPLAMIGATMIELDEAVAYFKGERLSAKEAMEKSGIKARHPDFKLKAKEAMGLTNGANFIAALTTFSLRDAKRILQTASISTALSLEAIRGEKRAFSELINENSDRHDGQIAVAKQLRELIRNSDRCTKKAQERSLGEGHKGEERVQDRYSFRCAPQVHGALYEAIQKLESTLTREINSATDNPLFDFDKKGADGGILFASGGNFHGQSLAAPIDYLKITLTSLGLITDRRTFSLLDKNLNYGLPEDLAKDTSKADGGYMITQYAGAARAAENRVLSTPASVMSVPTSANQEDFVSMGSIGSLHLRKIIYNCEILVAIELLCATRALQLLDDILKSDATNYPLGTQTAKVYERLKNLLGEYTGDSYLRTEMVKVIDLVKSGELIDLTSEVW
jgi:histidine ammonia-lyase